MRRQLDRKGVAAGLFYLLFGLAITAGSASYPFAAYTGIGPGFFPFLVGVALAITGIALTATAIGQGAIASTFEKRAVRPILFTTGGVVAFALLLESGGLVLAIPALFVCLALAQPTFSWRRLAGVSLALLPAAWLIFDVFLGMPVRLLPAF